MQIEKKLRQGQARPQSDFDKDLESSLRDYTLQVGLLLNRGLTFDDNFAMSEADVTFSGANVEVAVPHSLKKVPKGILIVRKDRACDVYDGSTAWTDTNIYLKPTVANAVVKLYIFASP